MRDRDLGYRYGGSHSGKRENEIFSRDGDRDRGKRFRVENMGALALDGEND